MEKQQTILITGASGLVGKKLIELLLVRKYIVKTLTRSKLNIPEIKSYIWSIENQTIEAEALNGVHTIIHLAGAGVADLPWTEKRKKEILDSRTLSTKLILKTIKDGNYPVKNFISASAIGYYDSKQADIYCKEDANQGKDFLSHVVKEWENEVTKSTTLEMRCVILRIGIVLAKEGGALIKLIPPAKFGLAPILGNSQNYMSWIHIEDLCRIFIYANENEKISGIYNSTSPISPNFKTFSSTLAKFYTGFAISIPTPDIFIKMFFGERSRIILSNPATDSSKIINEGFNFKYTDLKLALKSILKP